MTAADLRMTLITAGLPATLWQLADETFETVSAEWVESNWGAWLEARPRELVQFAGIGGKSVRFRPLWIAEASDCDNLALGVVTHAQVGNALAAQKRGARRGGLAFGVMFYTAEGFVRGPHAINWFVDHEQVVRFFEPAVGGFVSLNTAERSSAWFGLAA